jgi:hypothetical protein
MRIAKPIGSSIDLTQWLALVASRRCGLGGVGKGGYAVVGGAKAQALRADWV